MTITTIALAIPGVFGESRAASASSPRKDEGTLKDWLKGSIAALKRLAGKADKDCFSRQDCWICS